MNLPEPIYKIVSGTDKSCQDKLNEYAKDYEIKSINMAVAPLVAIEHMHQRRSEFSNRMHLVLKLTKKPEKING